MLETTLEVRIPAPLLQFGFDRYEIQRRVTEGYISSGKAARLLGITRVAFLALLRARGIAYINYTASERVDFSFALTRRGEVGDKRVVG